MNSYKELLNIKVQNEYSLFIEDIKNKSVNYVIEHAYEIVYKQDLMYAIIDGNLEEEYAKALYLQPNTLDYCYQEWLKDDLNVAELLIGTINEASIKAINILNSI